MNRWHIVIVATAGLLAGCIEREMTITSEPSGALVFVSDVEVGRTPVTRPFTWYGDYDIILRRQGYQTLKTHAHLNSPPYLLPPLDLFAGIAPWTVRDRRYLHFTLKPLEAVSDDDLVRRAEALRERNLQPVER